MLGSAPRRWPLDPLVSLVLCDNIGVDAKAISLGRVVLDAIASASDTEGPPAVAFAAHIRIFCGALAPLPAVLALAWRNDKGQAKVITEATFVTEDMNATVNIRNVALRCARPGRYTVEVWIRGKIMALAPLEIHPRPRHSDRSSSSN